MRRPLVLALAALLLSGCLGATRQPAADPDARALEPLTEAAHELGKFLAFDVKSFDGTPIHVDLQLPEGDGPFPTILEYTPYSILGDELWGLSAENNLGLQDYSLANEYVPYGYAVGVVHVRGTGQSGGCLTVGGPDEAKDGYEVVEHVASQPWSNGKVALVGTSYVGTTPIATAELRPPHLAAIVPMSGVTEWYKYYFELGAHRRNGDPFPGSSDTDPVLWGAIGMAPGVRKGVVGGPEEAACAAEFFLEDYAQDDYSPYWKARDLAALAANITVPVLYAQGWTDGNVAPNMIPRFLANLTGPDWRAWLQQHGHGVPGEKKAFYEYMHRFLDAHLLGKRNGADLLPRVIVEDNLGKYRAEDAWPPANLTSMRLYPASGWKLGAKLGSGTVSYHDDGTGSTEAALVGVNHVVFVSEPLAQDAHVAGVPSIRLKAASNMPGTHFDVLVYDRAPDGQQTLVTRGYLDARHRESLEQGKDLAPGATYDFAFPLHPNDYVVEKGHALALVVKSTDDYVVRSPYRATNTITLGEGTFLELPLVERAPGADAPPAPWAAS